MITQNLGKILSENAYPGRGIVIGIHVQTRCGPESCRHILDI